MLESELLPIGGLDFLVQRWQIVMTKHARKVLIGIVGGFVLLVGIAMIVLPGPAFVVIPAGLAILATEFEWARRWLEKARGYIHNKREAYRKKRAAKSSRT